MGQVLSLLRRLRSRAIAAVALYLAQPVKQPSPAPTADPLSLSSLLLPGDVLLSDGNTRAAAIVRRITRSPWSHVSMYVGPLETGSDPRCIVEADLAAGVQAVRLSELKGLHVRVLRPTGLDDLERRRLADWVTSRIGGDYDLAHAWRLATKLLRLPLGSRLRPPASMSQSATRFICSSLLAQAFMLVGCPIMPVLAGLRETAADDHRFVTPRDFQSAPVFEVVKSARTYQA
jgi:permuted papain-like amidase YaeF/Yiix C92 family enzyme